MEKEKSVLSMVLIQLGAKADISLRVLHLELEFSIQTALLQDMYLFSS